jgi:hydrogenase maturation factor
MTDAAGTVEHCDHEAGCITCGDTAVPMVVLTVDRERGLAVCASPGEPADTRPTETVETALVDPVTAGDRLLVHAGTALQTLETA